MNDVVDRARGIVRQSRGLNDETTRLARLSTEAPRIPWDVFYRNLRWEQGEHIALIGPTGQGKTTMLIQLLEKHPYVVAFATKPRDKTMDALVNYGGYVKIDRWRSMDPDKFPRRVLWPDASRIDSDKTQAVVFHDAFAKIYREGHWTVALDETWYLDNVLKLEKPIKVYLLQARSLGISLASAFQRPSWVPRELYTSSTHLMFWRTNDEVDLRSLGGIGAKSADLIREIVVNLESHQVLYLNTRTGQMCRTRCPDVQLGERR